MNEPAFNSNPPASLQRRQWMLFGAAAPTFMLAAWWALAPLGVAGINDAELDQRTPLDSGAQFVGPPADQMRSTDQSTFAINLWAPPPAQVAATTPPVQPPPPLNIQLIGIITDNQDGQPVQKAALYDVDEDRLLIVADGERVRDQTLRVLAGGVVELFDGQSSRRLLLRPDEGRVEGPG